MFSNRSVLLSNEYFRLIPEKQRERETDRVHPGVPGKSEV